MAEQISKDTYKPFLQDLKAMYNETRQWGSVTVTIKRFFEENFKGK